MHFKDGTLVRDQNQDFDGARGDSCFDSCAFGLSHFLVNKEYHPQLDADKFFTSEGTVRHPDVKWREDDMSTDNELALYMFVREIGDIKKRSFILERIKDRGWKTGNGQFISPGYFAELVNSQVLRCLFLTIQVIFFWFPVYWNDGAWKKGEWPLGNAWKKTDGYLQWALVASFAPWPFRRLISKATLKSKIVGYYKPEIDAVVNLGVTTEVLVAHGRMVDLL